MHRPILFFFSCWSQAQNNRIKREALRQWRYKAQAEWDTDEEEEEEQA